MINQASNRRGPRKTPEEIEKEKKEESLKIAELPIVQPPFREFVDDASPLEEKFNVSDRIQRNLEDVKTQELHNSNLSENSSQIKISKETLSILKLNIPLPKGTPNRTLNWTPFQNNPKFYQNLRQIKQPEQQKTFWIFYLALLSLIFLIFLFFQFSYFYVFYFRFLFLAFSLSIILFIIAAIAYRAQIVRQSEQFLSIPQYNFSAQQSDLQNRIERPSEMFLFNEEKYGKSAYDSTADATSSAGGSNSRLYEISDRPTSIIREMSYGQTTDYDQLSNDSFEKLSPGLTRVQFNIYNSNMKQFISKILLHKLAKGMYSDKPLFAAMLNIPGYDSCREYIMQRIISLSSSRFLSGNYGDKGDRWKEIEWTTDYPSDNQLILHVLSIWMSYFMGGRRKEANLEFFKQKYIYIKKEPKLENEDILICSDDWSNFYIYTQNHESKSYSFEKFYLPSGKDSLISALTLFFWFVKEKKNYLIDGADLKDKPMYMDKFVFTSSSEDYF